MGLGTGEIILIATVVILVFGASKLPQLGEGLGRAIGSFKRALSGTSEIESAAKKTEHDGAAQADKQAATKPTDKAS